MFFNHYVQPLAHMLVLSHWSAEYFYPQLKATSGSTILLDISKPALFKVHFPLHRLKIFQDYL